VSSTQKTLYDFFQSAARNKAMVEVHIDHPSPDFQRQRGICYDAHKEFFVVGPEGAPARVCVPYSAVKWFRRGDDKV
jgi:hypothetical protein